MQGSVVRSWLLELAGRAFRANGPDLEHLKGYVADSGEGRWTVQEAIDHDVPAPVITLSLLTRFRSRQDDSYGAKVLAALRNEFGGHEVKTELRPRIVRRRRDRDRDAATPPRAARHARRAGDEARRAGAARRARRPRRTRRRTPPRGRRTRRGRCASCAWPGRPSAGGARSRRRTRSARASASSASRTRACWSCSGRPATSPTARSCRRSTSCGARTSCRTSSSCCASAGGRYTVAGPPRRVPGSRSRSTRASCRSTRRPGASFASRIAYERLDFARRRRLRPPRRAPRGARPASRATGGNHLYYLATQPSAFAEIVAQLGRVGLDHERHDGGWRRIVIEKPFGHDLQSAIRLNREVGKVFRESQVYRIDHYLGKETVRNLLVFRFGNGIFEPIWNRRHIDHVQITVAESIGVENRGAFYEETGASRDFLQNHLLQLMSLVAMEPPATFEAEPAPRREGQGHARRQRDDAERVRRGRRPRPVRPGLGRGASRSRATARSRRSTRSRRPRRSSRPGSRSTTGAGRASRSTSGAASACRSGRPRSRSSSRTSRTGCSASPPSSPSRTCSRCGSSPTKGSCCGSRRRCPGSGSTSAR